MAKICSITVAVLWAALCFASLAVAQHPNQVPDPRFLQECCEDATKPGALDFSRLCNLQYKPRHRHPHDQQCFITFHGCCEEQKATKHCEQGKEAATNGLECPAREKQGEDRPYVLVHDCCQACKEGIAFASTVKDGQCPLPAGTIVEHAKNTCCAAHYAPESTTEANVASTATNLEDEAVEALKKEDLCDKCQFDCETKSDGKKVCKCPEGHKLHENGHACEDIDECSLEQKPCNLTTHECTNHIGGFTCVTKEPLGSMCAEGHYYDQASMTCKRKVLFDFVTRLSSYHFPFRKRKLLRQSLSRRSSLHNQL